MDNIFDVISEDYDSELKESQKISFEAYLAIAKKERHLASELFFSFYKISSSIKKVRTKIANLY